MRKLFPLVVALMISGVVCVVAAYFCHFYYTRHQSTVSDAECRINRLEMRLATLEAHKPRELRPVHVWGIISSPDRPQDERMHFFLSSEKRPEGYFEVINAKGGPLIRPELRVPVGSPTNWEYDIQIESQFGRVADVWLSHAEPYRDLAEFNEFAVNCPDKTNIVRLVARPRPGASFQMRFELVLLCQK